MPQSSVPLLIILDGILFGKPWDQILAIITGIASFVIIIEFIYKPIKERRQKPKVLEALIFVNRATNELLRRFAPPERLYSPKLQIQLKSGLKTVTIERIDFIDEWRRKLFFKDNDFEESPDSWTLPAEKTLTLTVNYLHRGSGKKVRARVIYNRGKKTYSNYLSEKDLVGIQVVTKPSI